MTTAGAPPAIVSASLNADVPARHGAWFMRRLAAGWCRIGRRDGIHFRRVSLTREAVAGFVFWTRDLAPFLPGLEEIRRLGYPGIVQFAIAGDAANARTAHALRAFGAAARLLGPRAMVWRYDPIVVTPARPLDWHLQNVAALAGALTGATDEVTIAFARLAGSDGTRGRIDPPDDDKRAFVRAAAGIARERGLRLTLCSQPDWLARGAAPARCIDARRLVDLGAGAIEAGGSGFVPGCLCARAVDLGDSEGAKPFFAGAVPPRATRAADDADREVLLPPRRTFARMAGVLPF